MGLARSILVLATASQLMLGQGKPAIVGVWRSQSSCEQEDSTCRDETVRLPDLAASGPAGSLSVSADKIVDRKAVNMGNPGSSSTWPSTRWFASMRKASGGSQRTGTKMEGTLTRPDGIVFSRVALSKE